MPYRVCIIDLKSVLGWLCLNNAEVVSYLRLMLPECDLLHYHQVSRVGEVEDADCFVVHVDTSTVILGREFLVALCGKQQKTSRILVYGSGAMLEPSYFAVSDKVQVVPSPDPAVIARNVTMQKGPQIPFCMGSDFSLLQLRRIRNYPIRTSRGCHYGCPFCLHSIIKKAKLRELDSIERELRVAVSEYHTEALTFWDPSLNLEDMRFKELLKLLRRIGLPWRSNGMTYRNIDAKMVSMLAESGCYLVSLGIESLNPEVQAGKNIDRRRLEHVIRLLQQAGIAVIGFFVVGLQNDTIGRSLHTIEKAYELFLDITLFTSAIAYPQTALHAHVSAVGRFLTDYKQLNLQCCGQINFETPYFLAVERIHALESSEVFRERNDTSKYRLEGLLGCPYTSSTEDNLLWDA